MSESGRMCHRDGRCAVIDPTEGCHAYWGQHNAFSAGSGEVVICGKQFPQGDATEGQSRPEAEAGKSSPNRS